MKANMPKPAAFDPTKMAGDPDAMKSMMAQSKAGKAAMVFVTIDTDTRKEADDFAAMSRSLLKDGNGMNAQAYVIEDDKVLFSIMNGADGYKLKDIVLTLPQVAEFEWDQQKTPGPAYASWKKKSEAKEAQKKDKEEV